MFDKQERGTSRVVGFEIANRSVETLCDEIVDSVFSRSGNERARWLACMNPHSYVQIRNKTKLTEYFQTATWLVPDGAGIVLASRLSKDPIKARVTGFDIFFGILSRLNKREGASVFFLGAADDTLERIKARVAKDFQNVRVVGTYSPPYKEEFDDQDNAIMIKAINAVSPDVLWVGMTAPKQEIWIAKNIDKLSVSFVGAIGAVFDFYAGKVKRSHPVYQKLNLEWLPRLLQEPRRLWRRTFVSAPIFVFDVLKARFWKV